MTFLLKSIIARKAFCANLLSCDHQKAETARTSLHIMPPVLFLRRIRLRLRYVDLGHVFAGTGLIKQTPDEPSWCRCGLCCIFWEKDGWACDGADVAYLASGRKLDLGPGCRETIAAHYGVPPGFVGRYGRSLCIGPCLGKGYVPLELVQTFLPWDMYRHNQLVPILPLEYYSHSVVDLMFRDLFIGADGSVSSVTFPKVYHVRSHQIGTILGVRCTYRIEFDSGYCSSSFLLDVLCDDVDIWLSHEIISVRPHSRCCRSIVRLQSRFRQRRADRRRADK